MICGLPGLLALEYQNKLLEPHMTMMPNGIVDKLLNQNLQVCLSKFSNHTGILLKNTLMELTSPVLNSTFTLKPQTLSRKLYPKEGGAKPMAEEEKPAGR